MTEESLEKKIRQKKNRTIVLVVVAVIIVAAVLFSLLRKPAGDGAYNAEVTLEIRCDTLSADMSQLNDPALKKYIPEDGTILAKTTCPVIAGQTTVFDVLEKACREHEIQMEFSSTPAYGGVYIEGINYLYELSAGRYSGWMFEVDGESPGYGADKVTLNGNEEIRWYYVVDYREGS